MSRNELAYFVLAVADLFSLTALTNASMDLPELSRIS